MRIIAVANQKGGCGKTTTSINFSACLAFLQKKVLLIDLDPQGHSTCGLGIRGEHCAFSLYDLLSPTIEARPDITDVACEINNRFRLLPSYSNLAFLEEEWMRLASREKMLENFFRQWTGGLNEWDYVVLDCPPNLGLLTANALHAADEILIPVEPSFFSLHGLAKISETLVHVNQKRKIPLRVHALLTLFNPHTSFAKEVYEEVKKHFQEKLFTAVIHEDVAFKEAASAGQSIVRYAPSSTAFQDCFNLAVEFLEREWDRLLPSSELGWQNLMANRLGPRRVVGGVLFQFMGKGARWVEIAGDFNRWIPETLVPRPTEGLWQKVIPITKGIYRYKYIVDGEWQIDPYHAVYRANAYGSMDSYLELS